MKILLSLFVLGLILLPAPVCQAQQARPAAPIEPTLVSEIVVGSVYTMPSEVLGEDREFRVVLPASYASSAERYPVVYVLDGDAYFLAAGSAVRALAGLGMMPEALVVAVTSPDRRADMTPPEVDVPMVSQRGGDKFLAHLADELIPLIDRKYRTLPLRILIGHSHGALFGAYALYARPEAFRWHLALDAPLHLGDYVLEKNIERFLEAHPDHKGRLSTAWNRYGWSPERWQKLVARAEQGFRASTFEVPGETHSSMYYAGMYQGLRQLFFDHEYEHDEVLTLDVLDRRYDQLTEEYGYPLRIPIWALRYGALEHLSSADPDKARPFIERLARDYGSTQMFSTDVRAWLEELETTPPDESRAAYLAREDATAAELAAYLGHWNGDQRWSFHLEEADGRIAGSIHQEMPDGQVLTSSIQKAVVLEDGSFELAHANGMPPLSGLITYHVVPVDANTLQVRQYFKAHRPSGQPRFPEPTFTLKRVPW